MSITFSRGRRNARHACVAVLSGLILFVLVQLGVAVAIESVLPEVRDPVYSCRLARVRRRLHADVVKSWTVLMLGSSHTQAAFRVGKVEEKALSEAVGHPTAAFNFGVPGGASLTELLNWNRLRRDGVRPTLLLVEVLPALLPIPPLDYGEVYLPTDRLSWRDLSLVQRYAGDSRKNLRRKWLECWPVACYAHRQNVMSLVMPDLLPRAYRQAGDETLDDSGVPRVGIWDAATAEQRLEATQIARDAYRPLFAKLKVGGPQCQALRELLASCHKEGVSVALVVTPEGPTFRSWYPPGSWDAVQEWLTQMSREYDVPFINARDWIDDENDYMDSHHLLLSGRQKFNERLRREFIIPLLKRSPDQKSYVARLP